MRVIYPGHRYELAYLDGMSGQDSIIQFVQRKPHHDPRPGTTNQEVCRVLIDRIKVLDSEIAWAPNQIILRNLREVIFLHEARAYERHMGKIGLPVMSTIGYVRRWAEDRYPSLQYEEIPVGPDGHWPIME